jgi:DNA-directed RNA polymerase subunit beta'
MQEKVDEVTGLSRKVIIESKRRRLRPRIDDQGRRNRARRSSSRRNGQRGPLLPAGRREHLVNDGDFVEAGDVIAKIPRETTKTKDITGGLPRVAELFEARKPKDHAVISRSTASCTSARTPRASARSRGSPRSASPKEYLIPKGKHLSVQRRRPRPRGRALMDGPANPHDILKVLGEKALAKYLVDEIQEVYRLQGVKINDKHIEVIVRQMLRRVKRQGRRATPTS